MNIHQLTEKKQYYYSGGKSHHRSVDIKINLFSALLYSATLWVKYKESLHTLKVVYNDCEDSAEETKEY